MDKTKEIFNVGFSDKQVCQIIRLYVRDDVKGQDLSAEFGVENSVIYTLLHNYGFNFDHTPGKSDVRGTFRPIFARYNLTEQQIDNCINKYIKNYRENYSPKEKKYYLQNMLLDLGKQIEVEKEKTSKESQKMQQPLGNPETGIDTKYVKSVGMIIIIIIGIICFMHVCSFVGDKLSDLSDFVSSDYEFEAFTYDGVMYAGNKKMNKPDGVCAGIPMRSTGTTYSLGEYDGSEIEGLGIICASDTPLQSKVSEPKEASYYDEAQLHIRMGQMEESVLNGYGIAFNASGEIVIGKYKNGQLKKYGCKVSLDENGDILCVDVVKGEKVKKHLENGTSKGITYYPEQGLIVIDEFEFTICAGQITMKTDGVVMSIKDRQWTFDLFNTDTEEGVYMDYILGENIKCQVTANDSKGILVNESEMPITYGTE